MSPKNLLFQLQKSNSTDKGPSHLYQLTMSNTSPILTITLYLGEYHISKQSQAHLNTKLVWVSYINPLHQFFHCWGIICFSFQIWRKYATNHFQLHQKPCIHKSPISISALRRSDIKEKTIQLTNLHYLISLNWLYKVSISISLSGS